MTTVWRYIDGTMIVGDEVAEDGAYLIVQVAQSHRIKPVCGLQYKLNKDEDDVVAGEGTLVWFRRDAISKVSDVATLRDRAKARKRRRTPRPVAA